MERVKIGDRARLKIGRSLRSHTFRRTELWVVSRVVVARSIWRTVLVAEASIAQAYRQSVEAGSD